MAACLFQIKKGCLKGTNQHIQGEYCCLVLTPPLVWYLKDHLEMCGHFNNLKTMQEVLKFHGMNYCSEHNHKPITGSSANYRNKRVARENMPHVLNSAGLFD